jgi:hypothetical protein
MGTTENVFSMKIPKIKRRKIVWIIWSNKIEPSKNTNVDKVKKVNNQGNEENVLIDFLPNFIDRFTYTLYCHQE